MDVIEGTGRVVAYFDEGNLIEEGYEMVASTEPARDHIVMWQHSPHLRGGKHVLGAHHTIGPNRNLRQTLLWYT